jgi:hypothetical protein
VSADLIALVNEIDGDSGLGEKYSQGRSGHSGSND